MGKMSEMGNELEAAFVGIIGATGCGKTTELKKRLAKLPKKKQRRVLIWSPKEEQDNYAALYASSVIFKSAADVMATLKKAGKEGKFNIVFTPTLNRKKDEALFDVVCKMVLAVGNCILIVDELHSVTTPTRAPDGWVKINFMGRGKGVHVFGLSQRPASVDKAFMGSLSALHVGRLPNPPDQKVMAEFLGVDHYEIGNLTGYQAIQRNMLTGEIVRVGYKFSIGKDGGRVKITT